MIRKMSELLTNSKQNMKRNVKSVLQNVVSFWTMSIRLLSLIMWFVVHHKRTKVQDNRFQNRKNSQATKKFRRCRTDMGFGDGLGWVVQERVEDGEDFRRAVDFLHNFHSSVISDHTFRLKEACVKKWCFIITERDMAQKWFIPREEMIRLSQFQLQ